MDTPGFYEQYRLYEVEADGHIAAPPRALRFSCDEEAVSYARALLDEKVLEIWQLDRLVACLDPNKPEP